MIRQRQLAKPAFTLVELLVVVAIIALLAAILFPVFVRARENARRISCVSNAKQIALAVFLYKDDTDGVFPPLAYTDTEGNDVFWPPLLSPYLKNQQIFLCPSDTSSTSYSYGLNAIAFADLRGNPGSSLGALRYDSTSTAVMLAETGIGDDFLTPRPDTFELPAPSQPLAVVEASRPNARHFETVTVGFLDGHVKALRLDQFYRGQTPPDRFFAP